MLLAFIFVLFVTTINGESFDQNNLRKPRQLNLTGQDIQNDHGDLTTTVQDIASSTEGNVVDGYLPPILSSLSPKLVTAQNQQVLDVKSVNSIETESNLCEPTSESDSCKPKENSVSNSKILEPSRELVPPLNDLEKDINTKVTTTLEPKTEETKVTEEQRELITTTQRTMITEKLGTKLFKASPTQISVNVPTTTTQINVPRNKAEATNELGSYLPPQPEYSVAAQTNFAITRPADQNNHHHDQTDHHHRHDENFNICTDAFHSFLCAPLKARKRITGALPSNLIGSSSYINYQKSLAILDKETAPSNEFRNEYLPPRSSPNNFIQSSFPTKKTNVIFTTTTRPKTSSKVIFRPINPNGRIPNTPYVKPSPSNRITESTPLISATSNKNYSNVVSNSLPSKIPVVFSTSTSLPEKAEVFSPISSSENIFYLPPNSNPQPSSSFISTSANFLPVTSTLAPLPSTLVTLPAITTFNPTFSNSVFLSEKPKGVYTTTSKPSSTAPIKASTALNAYTSSLPLQSSDNIYIRPSSEFASFSRSTSTAKPILSSGKFTEQILNTNNAYLPPNFKEAAAAQVSSAVVPPAQGTNPVHHGRDLCTDPFHSFLCASSKPRKRITGQLPAEFKQESSVTDKVKLKSEASNQDENRIRSDKTLKEGVDANLGYAYSKPINSLFPNAVTSPTLSPPTGYFYTKPDKIIPLPSQQDVKVAPSASSTTKKPELTLRPSESSVGYQYSKPDKIFSLPAEQEKTKITTTISSPTTGYSYPKPQKPFPLPSEKKEVSQRPKQKSSSSGSSSLSLPTNQVGGYQYVKPDQNLQLPEKKGYTYPKPEKQLELPTEGRQKSLLPQNNFNIDPLIHSESVDFIPVNKVEYKRGEPSKLLMGLRKFGERMKKRERQSQLLKRQLN